MVNESLFCFKLFDILQVPRLLSFLSMTEQTEEKSATFSKQNNNLFSLDKETFLDFLFTIKKME